MQFIIRRIISTAVSVVAITMVLYAGVMLTPPEARARLYLSKKETASKTLINAKIEQFHLKEPFLVQYGYWAREFITGAWGYSPNLRADVLPALLQRTPATLELAFYSLLLLIPLGLASGLIAGWRPNRWFDGLFRGTAFFATSMPPFIFSIFLLSAFYVQLHWFAPGRMDTSTNLQMTSSGFVNITGFLTLDSLLNLRFDFFLIALRHLAMPVLTLSMFHWATLGRITRATIITQRDKEYITAARARGVNEQRLIWRHALRANLAPSLTSMALSGASILTSVYVVEIIFGLPGVSDVIVIAMKGFSSDATATMGFAVYSVLMVAGLMFILDVTQALLDPRVRDEVLKT